VVSQADDGPGDQPGLDEWTDRGHDLFGAQDPDGPTWSRCHAAPERAVGGSAMLARHQTPLGLVPKAAIPRRSTRRPWRRAGLETKPRFRRVTMSRPIRKRSWYARKAEPMTASTFAHQAAGLERAQARTTAASSLPLGGGTRR
jgi:hypothetical protein